MKILIAGGQSSLAQVLRPALASFAEVLTAGRSGCDVELDMSWPVERFRLPQGVDVIINTVAHFGGGGFEAFFAAENVNTLGGLKLCHAALKSGARNLVNISSINACLDSRSEYYGIYALSKRHADESMRLFCDKEGLPCTILRPSQLYGDMYGFRKHQPLLYSTIDRALSNEDIVIYGGRDALRNYLHADDFCRIIVAVVGGHVNGVYSCTSSANASLLEVAHAAVKAAGSRSKVVFNATMKDIPDNIFPYDDTLYREIGVYPAIGIEEGIARLVARRLAKL